MTVLEEVAVLTNNPWDDLVVKTARSVLEKYFNTPFLGGQPNPMLFANKEMAALPVWILPVLMNLIEILKALDFKQVEE